jgi:hypothetical protein
MVWDVSFTCDMCGKQKGESNHWWMAAVEQPASLDEPHDQPRSVDRRANQGHNGSQIGRMYDSNLASLQHRLCSWQNGGVHVRPVLPGSRRLDVRLR